MMNDQHNKVVEKAYEQMIAGLMSSLQTLLKARAKGMGGKVEDMIVDNKKMLEILENGMKRRVNRGEKRQREEPQTLWSSLSQPKIHSVMIKKKTKTEQEEKHVKKISELENKLNDETERNRVLQNAVKNFEEEEQQRQQQENN